MSPALVAACGAALALALALAATVTLRLRPATSRAVLLGAVVVACLAPALALAGPAVAPGILAPSGAGAPSGDRSTSRARPMAPNGDIPPQEAPTVEEATTAQPGPSAPPVAHATAVPTDGPGFPWLAALWGAGAAAGIVGIVLGLGATGRMRRACVPAADVRVREAAARAAHSLGLDALDVREGSSVPSPVTVGLLRPAVLLPIGLAATLDDDHLAAVLLHEGAHVARRDPLWGCLARVARAFHWFDPLAHLAARRLRDVSESLADATVVSAGDAVSRERYANCLVRITEAAFAARAPAALWGMAGRRGTLERRVTALFAPGADAPPRLRARGRALAAAVVVVSAAALLVAHEGAARAGDEEPLKPAGPGLTYSGRVVDPEGKAVAGATVYLVHGPSPQVMIHDSLLPWREIAESPPIEPVGGNAIDKAPAPTDADGRFSVTGVAPPAGGTVVVVHPSFAPLRAPAEAREVRGPTIEVGDLRVARGGALRARVVDEKGAPVAGAWVVVQPAAMPYARFSPGEIRSARSGADGSCVIEGLRDAEYVAGAFTETAPPAEHPFTAAAGKTHEAELRLKEGATLRVVVLDRATGAPLAGARVDIDPKPPPGPRTIEFGVGVLASARTDASGVATFRGVPDVEYDATAVPPDRAEDGVHHPPPFSVTASGRPGKDLEIRMDPAVPFAIAAVDAETGAPVRGLLVEANAEWGAYDRTGGFPVAIRREFQEAREAFPVDGIRAGPWRFSLFAPDHLPLRTDVVQVGRVASPLRVELRPAKGSARGRVVARAGVAPVAGAAVSVYEWVQNLGDGQRTSATTGEDGSFAVSPLLGSGWPLRVEVSAPGFLTLVVERDAGGRGEDLGDLPLVRAARLTGVLVDAEGVPIAHVGLTLLPEGQDPGLKGERYGATTDAQGRFAVERLRPSRYRFLGKGIEPGVVEVAEGAEVEVRVRVATSSR